MKFTEKETAYLKNKKAWGFTTQINTLEKGESGTVYINMNVFLKNEDLSLVTDFLEKQNKI